MKKIKKLKQVCDWLQGALIHLDGGKTEKCAFVMGCCAAQLDSVICDQEEDKENDE